jgi:hypothetical protein
MATQPAHVSVTWPLHPAVERTKRLLFQPFDLGKWFTIGFCAWLAHLGEGGFNGGSALRSHRFPGANRRGALPSWERAHDWVMQNLHWLLPLAVALACLAVILGLLFVWLRSRGEFMFVHCVALDRAEVAVPWRKYAPQARSLFLFRLALGLIAAVPILLLLASIGLVVVRMVRGDGTAPGGALSLAVAGTALLVLGVGFLVVAKLTTDFVVPIMFLRGGTCREAWRELLGLFSGRASLLIVYLLFQIALGIAIGILILVAVIATCCLAGCLIVIPYIGTVVLLPVLVFQRSYSLFYLAQLGARYDVFQPAAPPAAPA